MNDGGPAFPVDGSINRATYGHTFDGMSLRDYFAGQALVGYLSHPINISALKEAAKEVGKSNEDFLAIVCYQHSDAMLKAREAKD